MPDYSKTLIYKLCCKNLDVKDIYVGSTCNFTKRKYTHKSTCNNINDQNYNRKVYKFIRENGGFENWDMIMVEEYPCENKMQKLQRERYWYEELKANLNIQNPKRSQKEYRLNNSEKIKDQKKEYYQNNLEKYKEQRKEYYKNNSEKIKEQKKEYTLNNVEKIKEQRKEYRLNNAEKIKEQKKKYRLNNAEKIKEQKKKYRLNNAEK